MEKKEILFLANLRKNARKNLTTLSRLTGIPVSTLFEKLKRYEGNLIKKHVSIIDFTKLGFHVRAYIALKVHKQERDKLRSFLEHSPLLNCLYRITNGYDFLLEALFKNISEFQDFLDELDNFKIQAKQQFYILEEIKRESFFSDEQTLLLLGKV
ncbi:MAG: Lrp/AsnC family transcriptional regulator [Candidatus Woesearchaeota archaeon]